jgi:hypothetical protein
MAEKKLSKKYKQELIQFEEYLVSISKEILQNPLKHIAIDGHIIKVIVFPDNTIEFVSYGNAEGIPVEEQRILSKAETLNLLIKGAKIKYGKVKNKSISKSAV